MAGSDCSELSTFYDRDLKTAKKKSAKITKVRAMIRNKRFLNTKPQ